MEKLEIQDIQGIIIRGYANLKACNFLLLAIQNKVSAKLWLKAIEKDITPGNDKPPASALNIAFTFAGLKELGLDAEALEAFPLEFEDGMTTAHKKLLLGDLGTSDPEHWNWGGGQNEDVHILLMMYAEHDAILNELYQKHKTLAEIHGLQEVKRLETSELGQRKEHFGFRDGIAQPVINGLSKTGSPENTVAPGEFILGYKNSYDQYPDAILVNEAPGNKELLPQTQETNKGDFSKNGSYLVFRQMEQYVELFWRYMERATTVNGVSNDDEMVKLAAKMVGRWPGGAPISVCPDKDDESLADHDSFAYGTADSAGFNCPIGSHIRRTNPRDAMDMNIKASVEIANKHRILRRGRSYGKPVCESLNPKDILNSKNFDGERGLHFICFNTDISRQFEFIQNAWVNNPKLFNLYHERDPLIGNINHPEDELQTGVFSVPKSGLRKRYNNVPEFVVVKGGAYFFMPGLKALKYLSSI